MSNINLFSVDQARKKAKLRLPKVVFDYIDGAADDEVTMNLNTRAFDDIMLNPKMAQGKFDCDLSTSVLGQELALPVILAPCGLVRVMHPDGAIGVAKAAINMQTISVLSTVAGNPLSEVAETGSHNLWFQLYSSRGRQEVESLLQEIHKNRVSVLVVTVDTPALGNRLRDIYNGVSTPLRVTASNAVQLGYQVLSKPKWSYNMLNDGLKLMKKSKPSGSDSSKNMLNMAASPFSWEDIKWIRSQWRGKLVIKGILNASDAKMCVDCGADAIVISNHGGRQLEGVSPTIKVLSEVVSEVGDQTEVILDSGIRRGTHVIKAIALGAKAVMIGRPYLYGLAANGQMGVENILRIFQSELIRDMTLLGCRSIKDLDKSFLV